MTREVQSPSAAVQPLSTPPSSMTVDPDAKPFGGSSEPNLPAIDETKPCEPGEDVPVGEVDSKDSDEWRVGPAPESPSQRKGVKGKLKGLADKYVSCLQAAEGATGDMRGFASGGAPAMVPAPQPFDSPNANPASH